MVRSGARLASGMASVRSPSGVRRGRGHWRRRGRIGLGDLLLGHRGERRESDEGAEAHRDIFIDHCSSFGSESFDSWFTNIVSLRFSC